MSASKLNILISGAGIAGTCAAYWVARTSLNVSITVIERSPNPRTTGQSLDIRGPAVEIIRKMKLEEAIKSRHTTEEATIMVDSAGKTYAQFKAGDTFTADFEILRADLAGLFMEAVENMDNVKYVYDNSIQSLEQTDTSVNVTFSDGSKDTFDLLIAADGSSSKTRAMILDERMLQDSYNFLGQYIAFFSIPSQPNDRKVWQWYNATNGLGIMTRPHRTGSTVGAYMAITMPEHGQRDPTLEEALRKGTHEQKQVLHEYFEDAGWQAKRVLKGMDNAPDFYMSRAALVKLDKWTNNRAVLIGDAAFATFGVGTSLAIESAYVLAGELSKIKSSSNIPQALERYEQAFRPLHAKIDGLLPGYPQVFFPQTAWGLWLRNTFLRVVSKSKVYKLLPKGEAKGLELPSYEWKNV